MAVNREDAAATGPRPLSSQIGPDLRPRIAAAVVLGLAALVAAWAGGVIFVAFWWIASIIVLWEWQTLVQTDRRTERVAAGALGLALAALFAMHQLLVWALAALIVTAGAVGWIAGPSKRIWAATGALYAGALVVSLGLLRASPNYGLAAISVALCGCLGRGYRGLFRGPPGRGPAPMAERLAGEDLVRGGLRRGSRRSVRPSARRMDEQDRSAVLARARDGGCVRTGRSFRNPR